MTLDEHLAGLYINRWAVFDIATDAKAFEYKTKELAEKACEDFEQHGLPSNIICTKSIDMTDITDELSNNPQLKQNRYSNKRPMELADD